jgi:hypothetical protein
MFHVKRFVVTFYVRTNMYGMAEKANWPQAIDAAGPGVWLNCNRYGFSGERTLSIRFLFIWRMVSEWSDLRF